MRLAVGHDPSLIIIKVYGLKEVQLVLLELGNAPISSTDNDPTDVR